MDRTDRRFLNPTRLAILEFIKKHISEHGSRPQLEEIAKACGIKSKATVYYHLRALEQAGFPTLPEPLPPRKKPQARLPGQPIPTAQPDSWTTPPEDIIPVPAHLVRGRKNLFALRVKGKSMVDAHILDGDILIFEHVRAVENGQMAAVWLRNEQETTLKKVYHEGDRIRLQPANDTMKPTYHRPDNVDIQGRVVAVIRKFEA